MTQLQLVEGGSSVPRVRVASRITGTGMFVPERVVANDYFASYLETSDEWIRERSGIRERRFAEPDVSASALAAGACRAAISSAGLKAEAIDAILCATVSPDYQFPSTACCLQKRLGISGQMCVDLSAACTGFVYALVMANGLIATGQCRHILVVGVDLLSRICDPQDRTTCVLFGDGAGAVVLSAAEGAVRNGGFVEGSGSTLQGIYASELHADGSVGDMLCVPVGTACTVTPQSLAAGEHYLKMNGREVFKIAVRVLVEVSERVLVNSGFTASDLDHYVSHQANMRILSSVGHKLGLPPEKVLSNVDRFGNTSAASIPILLAESVTSGTIKSGDLIMLSAVGGGMTWGAMLLRW